MTDRSTRARSGARAAAVLALLGVAGGCGSSASSGSNSASSAPKDASKTAFCQAIQKTTSTRTPHELAEDLRKVGTPSGISASSRHGFEVLVRRFETLPNDPQKSDLQRLIEGASPTVQTDIEAFFAYAQTECGPAASAPSSPSSG